MQDESIVIVGGRDSSSTTGEIVPGRLTTRYKHDTHLLENLQNKRIILTTGGTVFDLQNGGHATCAVKFQQQLVVIGGKGDSGIHGKVDR